jgi:hypothetical protein
MAKPSYWLIRLATKINIIVNGNSSRHGKIVKNIQKKGIYAFQNKDGFWCDPWLQR